MYHFYVRQARQYVSGHMRKAVSQIVPVRCGIGDESNCTFMDSGTYCGVCYNRNHITLQCRHLEQITQFVGARNKHFETGSGINGNEWRQAWHHTSRSSRPSQRNSALQEILSKSKNKLHNTRYAPRLIHGFNLSLSSSLTDQSANVPSR